MSLNNLERNATKRLTDHANTLLSSLSRRRTARATSSGNGGRSSGASGWSVASDSQLSVDAPADHGGTAPATLRGGGTTDGSFSPNRGGSASAQCQTGTAQSPLPSVAAIPPANVGGTPPAPPVATMAAGRMPTPWLDQHGMSSAEATLQDKRYSRVFPADDSIHMLTPPPGMDPGSSLLLSSAWRVSTLGKCWHGGGHASSFLTGVEYLSPEQVVALGVPPSMAFVIISSHHQILSVEPSYGPRWPIWQMLPG